MTDAEKQASPAPLDVPRLEFLLRDRAREMRNFAIEALDDGETDGYWKSADQLEALAAALSGLVEAGALLDRTERWLRDHPHETLELTMNDYNSPGGDIAAIHFDDCGGRSMKGFGATVRRALSGMFPPAAPALREEGDHA